MLKAALLVNPQSIVLFSSKSAGHVAANAQLVDDPALDQAAHAFYRLVQAKGADLLNLRSVVDAAVGTPESGGA